MIPQRSAAITSALGPLSGTIGNTPAPSASALTGQGIQNATVGTSATKTLAAHATPNGRVRRLQILNLSSSAFLAWSTAAAGSSSTSATTASGTGTATDGVLIPPSAPPVEISIVDNLDLYLVASAAATPYQLVCVEQ